MTEFDVAVIGVGALGSAILFHLARRGLKVIGIERYDIPDGSGMPYGVTGMIRKGYSGNPAYVPLLDRAYELWRELEEEFGERLLFPNGFIDVGPPDSEILEGSQTSCQLHNLPYEILDAQDVNTRFPGFNLPEDLVALYQPFGGYILSDLCVAAHISGAMSQGAELHGRERVLFWKAANGGVRLFTELGTYSAHRLIICSGAGSPKLVPELSNVLVAERQVLGWFQPLRGELFRTDTFPVFNLQVPEGIFYGFPIKAVPGFKVGKYHHLGQEVSPDITTMDVTQEDEEILRTFINRYFPLGAGSTMALRTRIFTNTPDSHFIIDFYPDVPQVCLAAGFSGQATEFSGVVGEIIADLVQKGYSDHDLSLFTFRRFI